MLENVTEMEKKQVKVSCINIEALIGAGKTTLIQALYLHFEREQYNTSSDRETHFMFITEPVDDWANSNILTLFYKDPLQYSRTFQTYITVSLFNRELKILKNIYELIDRCPSINHFVILKERFIQSSEHFFIPVLLEKGVLSPVDAKVLIENANLFLSSLNKSNLDWSDYSIYLDVPISQCLNQIKRRNRSGEVITIDYLQLLDKYLHSYFTSHTPTLHLHEDICLVGIQQKTNCSFLYHQYCQLMKNRCKSETSLMFPSFEILTEFILNIK